MICWLEGDGHQVLESLEYLKIIGYFRTLGGRLTSGGRLPHWHYPVTQPDKINLNSSAPSKQDVQAVSSIFKISISC